VSGGRILRPNPSSLRGNFPAAMVAPEPARLPACCADRDGGWIGRRRPGRKMNLASSVKDAPDRVPRICNHGDTEYG